jgi:hypothetical protein
MSIIDQISKTKLGTTPAQLAYKGDSYSSTLHYKYSTEGTPFMKGYPRPTRLGTSFKSATPPMYSQNPPK